ncbi:MAG: DUF3463 domain-containing protein [Candidatus Altiarchaeales archaeon]|nr:DUF3463 domain-containing protein [Candidatus Altiarchaeales archaeon]MBD3417064.1 DUF3463 domain-containing protein [Candidatus Altiarchaeales archaeon]
MRYGFRDIPLKAVAAYLENLFRIKVLGDERNLKPMLSGFYITRNCNFRCGYCAFRDNNDKGLNTGETKEILGKIRRVTPGITLTGGEPLLRPDIIEILKEAKRLKFKPIILFTNLSLLDSKEEVLEYVDIVSTSLDRVDDRYDELTNVKGSAKKIMDNIVKYSKLQDERGFTINVNCVIGEHNMDNVSEVAGFVFENNCGLSIGPVVERGAAPEYLKDNEEYKRIMDRIIEMKREGYPINTSLRFLETVRDFKPFKCRPFIIPRIFSNGDVFHPCEVLKEKSGNLLEHDSYEELIEGFQRDEFRCDRTCFIACYGEPSLLIDHPLDVIKEFACRTRH